MGLFGKKNDWNVIAIMFDKRDQYTINGNRGKGSQAETIRDNVKRHKRTLFWAVFDQKGAFLEGGQGQAHNNVTEEIMRRLEQELPRIGTVRTILRMLESGKTDRAAKALEWDGYPTPRPEPAE